MSPSVRPLLVTLLLVALVAPGCATRDPFGRCATPLPNTARVVRAARTAALDPQTWVPLAAAAALQIDDADTRITKWGIRERPFFGNLENAQDIGADIRTAMGIAMYGSGLAAPSGPFGVQSTWRKVRGMSVLHGAFLAQAQVVERMKAATERERPDGSNTNSFPSSRASDTAAYAALLRRNLERYPMPRSARLATDVLTTGATTLTSWSRVEAEKHFLSDALVGQGVGNFIAVFVHDAFLGRARCRAGSLCHGCACCR